MVLISSQRIGRDLFLESEAGQPLSKAKLEPLSATKAKSLAVARSKTTDRAITAPPSTANSSSSAIAMTR